MTSPDGNGFTVKEIVLRIEQKLDDGHKDHETRLRSLEKWKWGLPAVALTTAAAAIATIFTSGGPS